MGQYMLDLLEIYYIKSGFWYFSISASWGLVLQVWNNCAKVIANMAASELTFSERDSGRVQ